MNVTPTSLNLTACDNELAYAYNKLPDMMTVSSALAPSKVTPNSFRKKLLLLAYSMLWFTVLVLNFDVLPHFCLS